MRERRRLLGVDYGTVRIGLAISDPDYIIASPLETYTRRSLKDDAKHFVEVIEREEVARLVVGFPLHTNGREGQKAAEVRTFVKWLGEQTGLSITLWDERFTTVFAESALWDAGLTHKKRRDRRDRVAAQLLLQSYLDAGCPIDPAPPTE